LAASLAALTSEPSWGEESFPLALDELGRPLLPPNVAADSFGIASATGLSYEGVATFKGKPKVFVAGATGELGRRVVLDLLKGGYSVRAGFRDKGRARECQYKDTRTSSYELTAVQDVFVEGGREKELQEAIGDAAVVIDLAGARPGFDVLRLGDNQDSLAAERVDGNGTKALIDAARASGVKKFIYISEVLSNGRALGLEESDGFKNLNSFGNVLDFKHQAEEYLKRSGLDYTIIRPAPLTSDFPRDVGGIWFGKADAIRLEKGEVGSKVSRDDVSLTCVDAIFNPKASKGIFELVGVPRKPPTGRQQWWQPAESAAAA